MTPSRRPTSMPSRNGKKASEIMTDPPGRRGPRGHPVGSPSAKRFRRPACSRAFPKRSPGPEVLKLSLRLVPRGSRPPPPDPAPPCRIPTVARSLTYSTELLVTRFRRPNRRACPRPRDPWASAGRSGTLPLCPLRGQRRSAAVRIRETKESWTNDPPSRIVLKSRFRTGRIARVSPSPGIRMTRMILSFPTTARRLPSRNPARRQPRSRIRYLRSGGNVHGRFSTTAPPKAASLSAE